jgi:hypothetical protein
MAADYNLQSALRSYLRRKFATDLTGLRRLADDTFCAATDTVTLTSLGFEGGSQSGQITCPKGLLLGVIESLIAELDPTAPAPAPIAAVMLSR